MNQKEKIEIYTDGACAGNPGPGGWGAVLLYKSHKKEISGFMPLTTNNQMELKAVIEALKSLKKSYPVIIYTDSIYVKEGISNWINSWKQNGWKTSAKKPVKNLELWQELDMLSNGHQISWKWLKGHAGHYYNELADRLAREAISSAGTL